MYTDDAQFLEECRKSLLQNREETLNHLNHLNEALKDPHKEDSAGLASSMQEENYRLSRGQNLSLRLKQIDEALARMESGHYGYCIETGEPIERKRLEMMPWTLLSVAGAELTDQRKR